MQWDIQDFGFVRIEINLHGNPRSREPSVYGFCADWEESRPDLRRFARIEVKFAPKSEVWEAFNIRFLRRFASKAGFARNSEVRKSFHTVLRRFRELKVILRRNSESMEAFHIRICADPTRSIAICAKIRGLGKALFILDFCADSSTRKAVLRKNSEITRAFNPDFVRRFAKEKAVSAQKSKVTRAFDTRFCAYLQKRG